MKTFISILLLVPILLFAAVVVTVVRRAQAAPSAFSIKDFPMPSIGEPPKSDDPQILAGWKVYTGKGCVYCHGAGGVGQVKNPGAVGGLVPSLVNVGEGYNLDELKKKIRDGVRSEDITTETGAKGPPLLYMPSWGDHLTKQEFDDLAHYLMGLAPKKSGESWE